MSNEGNPGGVGEYQVELDLFRGPLYLLLQLIERAELDITAVSLAQVTGQFLAYVQKIQEMDLRPLADFMVVASRLIYIKSRALLPGQQEVEEEGEEEDDGEALARRIREYKLFRDKAAYLSELLSQKRQMFVRPAASPAINRRLELDGVDKWSLRDAIRAVERGERPEISEVHIVTPHPITIHQQIGRLKRLLGRVKKLSFRRFIRRARSRTEIVVSFLAVLEMIRRREVKAEQEKPFGDILLERTTREKGGDTEQRPGSLENPPVPAGTRSTAESRKGEDG